MSKKNYYQTKKGSARLERTDPRRETLEVERSTAKKTALQENSSNLICDQSVERARVAVDEVVASWEALAPEDRARIVALAGVAVVLGQARDLAPKEAAARAGCSTATVLRWVARFGIGRRIGGRYVVDAARLDALLAGGVR